VSAGISRIDEVAESVDEPAPRVAAPADVMIRAEGLTKCYPGAVTAVDRVDLGIGEGEIFGLLGPNGAGKSTTVGMLTTRVVPSSGRVLIGGVDVVADPAAAKELIGVVPQANTLDRGLSVRDNLYFHGRYFGLSRRAARTAAGEWLDRFQLGHRARAGVESLSGGMARRLMLARAMLHGPPVVFLDEPTAGLDPQSRIVLWEAIGELHRGGHTIVLTTNHMEEAERFCDRVAIMDHGRILALDHPGELRRSHGGGAAVTVRAEGEAHLVEAHLRAIPEALEVTRSDGAVRVRLRGTDSALATVVEAARRGGFRITDLSLCEDSLETVFINLTGRDLRE